MIHRQDQQVEGEQHQEVFPLLLLGQMETRHRVKSNPNCKTSIQLWNREGNDSLNAAVSALGGKACSTWSVQPNDLISCLLGCKTCTWSCKLNTFLTHYLTAGVLLAGSGAGLTAKKTGNQNGNVIRSVHGRFMFSSTVPWHENFTLWGFLTLIWICMPWDL